MHSIFPYSSKNVDEKDDKEDKGKYLCWWVYHDLTNDSIFSSLKGEKRFDALIEKLAPYYY